MANGGGDGTLFQDQSMAGRGSSSSSLPVAAQDMASKECCSPSWRDVNAHNLSPAATEMSMPPSSERGRLGPMVIPAISISYTRMGVCGQCGLVAMKILLPKAVKLMPRWRTGTGNWRTGGPGNPNCTSLVQVSCKVSASTL
uniref:Uncharacterized protein n=1 Tax=Triticum urartu TaxID=4572 RepID=A0A8R7VCD5_TRIUA